MKCKNKLTFLVRREKDHFVRNTKIATFLLSVFVISLFAEASQAQPLVPPLNLENVRISQVIKAIEDSSDYVFLVDDAVKRSLEKTVTVKTDRMEVTKVLDQALRNTGLTYIVTGNQIAVVRQTQQQQPANVAVRGTVRDEKGNPLAGVAVILKSNTMRGTVTDGTGAFSISVPANSVLVFSFIGMEQQEVTLQPGAAVLSVTMKASSTQIEEVTVVETGIFRRDKVTFAGSAPTYTGQELRQVGGGNILQSLSVLDPAFVLMEDINAGSDPNASYKYELRGQTTATLTAVQDEFSEDPNMPLFVLNGIIVKADRIKDLDPDRIQSVTILKDAASAAIYGSKAANGVVVIETVKPTVGEYVINYTFDLELQAPDLSVYNMMNAAEKLEFDRLSNKFRMTSRPGTEQSGLQELELQRLYSYLKGQVDSGVDTDWLSKPVRTGVTHAHSLRVTGGSEQLAITVGAKFSKVQGTMKGDGRETWGGDISLNYRVGKFIINNDAEASGYTATGSPYGSYKDWVNTVPYYPVYNEDGGVDKWLFRSDGLGSYNPGYVGGWKAVQEDIPNPLYNAKLPSKNTETQFHLSNHLYIQFRPNNDLMISGGVQLERYQTKKVTYKPAQHTDFVNTNVTMKGTYYNRDGYEWKYKLYLKGNYAKIIDRHTFTADAEISVNQNVNNHIITEAEGFPVGAKGAPNLANAYKLFSRPGYDNRIQREMGIAVIAGYNYDKRYILDFTFKYDGSTSFGSNELYKPFFSVAAGWNIDREKFMQNAGWVDMLKIYANYGKTGNQNMGKVYSKSVYKYYVYSNIFGQGAYLSALGAPNVPWQVTANAELGLSFRTMKGRLSLDVKGYSKISDPLVLPVSQIPSTGLKDFPMHLGKLTVRGIEFDFRFSPVYRLDDRIYWTVAINGDHYTSEYSGFGDALAGVNEELIDNHTMRKYQDGCHPYDIWAVRSYGIDPATGREVFIKEDGSMTFTYDAADQVVVGMDRPKLKGSIYTTFRYKNFDMTLALKYQTGGHVYNTTLFEKVENITRSQLDKNQDKRALYDRWKKPGDNTEFKGITVVSAESPRTSRFVQKDNFLRGYSFRVGYELRNKEWLVKNLAVRNLTLSVYGEDLFRLETSRTERGIDYPFARKFTFQARFTF